MTAADSNLLILSLSRSFSFPQEEIAQESLNMFYMKWDCCRFNQVQTWRVSLVFVWPCIIDTNNIDSQLDATITVY